ncbi:MAG: alpha-amylase [Candidatus Kapabacteria bacterium]|nr:alpha-amylase [Candidatus Kapabacteria bacterium]
MDDENLQLIKNHLLELSDKFKNYTYYIPSFWLDYKDIDNSPIKINPIEFFILNINELYNIQNNYNDIPQKVEQSVIYNFIPRLFTSYDHNGDGKIELTNDINTFRETGTFLKTIALLPYLKRMGINTIYMLPIFEIGRAHRRGNLGSVYAIKNIYKFDENLNEPVLEIPIEKQFTAFVEAAHLVGMKVVLEFIFRTASLDCDLIPEHPNWFYWIYAKNNEKQLLPPKFSKRQYNNILEKINNNDFSELPPPPTKYTGNFSPIPKSVALENGEYIGKIVNNEIAKVPNGFADWPPNDAQPIWSDVTYFRLYDYPEFNYIAYNTVRMYSSELARDENKVRDLWEYIENIIPYYIKNYDIDGAMIDMGHSLPAELLSNIIEKARDIKADFIFFEENFELTHQSKQKGFDAAIGPLFLIENDFSELKKFLRKIVNNEIPIPFFSTSENHNTPRTYSLFNNENFSRMILVLNSLLPGLLFIHSGFELFEDKPINTGLNFTKSEIKKYSDEELALFSISSLNWNRKNTLFDLIQKTVKIRKEWFSNSLKNNSSGFHIIENWHYIEIELYSKIKEQYLHFIAKLDETKANPNEIKIDLNDIILSNRVKIDGNSIVFEKFGFLLYKSNN